MKPSTNDRSLSGVRLAEFQKLLRLHEEFIASWKDDDDNAPAEFLEADVLSFIEFLIRRGHGEITLCDVDWVMEHISRKRGAMTPPQNPGTSILKFE